MNACLKHLDTFASYLIVQTLFRPKYIYECADAAVHIHFVPKTWNANDKFYILFDYYLRARVAGNLTEKPLRKLRLRINSNVNQFFSNEL